MKLAIAPRWSSHGRPIRQLQPHGQTSDKLAVK